MLALPPSPMIGVGNIVIQTLGINVRGRDLSRTNDLHMVALLGGVDLRKPPLQPEIFSPTSTLWGQVV
eukprot:1621406-Alexandrium_andersonii.AAC.1